MCGIQALYAQAGALPAAALAAAQAAVPYRGPDDAGILRFGRDGRVLDSPAAAASLALVHRRLSIVDLSPGGHQPMASADGERWIIYNGEIYNYVELREELRALGHEFRSQSDTEVILAAYREWGRECLHRLNGMFALVLYDAARQALFAARDRYGVKPLYYWISPAGVLAFASEIKQFAGLPGWQARVNGQRAYEFLNWGVLDHSDETLFQGVYQLRGGEAVELRLDERLPAAAHGRLPVHRWYELRARPFEGTLEEAGREFRRLFTDSVRLRLRADVPVGSCLSGGLDSSSIVCVLNELLRERGGQAMQKTFSAGATVSRYDEREFIETVVRHTSADAHYVTPALDGLFPLLDRITWHQDEPFGSTSIYAQWRVFALAAERGVKVMLDGQGADELIAGYRGFFGARYGGLLRGLRWATLLREARRARELHRHPAQYIAGYALGGVLPEFLRRPMRRLAGQPGRDAPWLDFAVLGAEPSDPLRAGAPSAPYSVSEMSRSQLTGISLPMLLHWEDRNSMAHSVEARLPFLDYRLVEFVFGLPDGFKIGDGTTKRVLREGLRGVLPERIRQRTDKLGFATPEEVWVVEEGAPQFRRALADAIDASGGIVRPQVARQLEDMIERRRPYSYLIWRLISFGTWMRVFSVRHP